MYCRSRSVAVVAIRLTRESTIPAAVRAAAGLVTTLPRVIRVPLLVLIVAAGFFLRVWHNDYGLPYVWGIDEGFHFTNRAVDMFRHGLDPGYYQNPTAYT